MESFFDFILHSGVDIAAWLTKVSAPDWIIERVNKSGAGYLALAYVMYKIISPLRYAVTLAVSTA